MSYTQIDLWILVAMNAIWFVLHMRAINKIEVLEQDFASFHMDAVQYMAGIRAMREPIEEKPGMP